MYKINGLYIYLTKAQFDYIFDIVAKNEDAVWHYASLFQGTSENIELHKRIQQYIRNNFKEEYHRFDFYGEDAKDNIQDILFDYATLTDTIKIFRADDVSPADMWEETVTGPDIKKIRIKIYEKIFFGLFGKRDTGNSITIKIKEIDHVYGELTNFTAESKTFSIRFTKDNVSVTYK